MQIQKNFIVYHIHLSLAHKNVKTTHLTQSENILDKNVVNID